MFIDLCFVLFLSGTQYLAIGCHNRLDEVHLVRKKYSGKNLIQIWDMGAPNDPNHVPHMVMGIAHQGGYVHDMKWVPSSTAVDETLIAQLTAQQQPIPQPPELGGGTVTPLVCTGFFVIVDLHLILSPVSF